MKYPFVARSDSDPNGEQGGLGFAEKARAEAHVQLMNSRIHIYDENKNNEWNKSFWKEKPLPWGVHEYFEKDVE